MSARRTALITGSGQNIGRAVAEVLAKDGFNIVLNGMSNRAACEEVAGAIGGDGVQTEIAMGDVGTREGCASVAKAALDRFGRVDVMVHNAAVRPTVPFLEMQEADWHRVMDINLTASFWLAQACLPGMVEAGWGRVILFAGMNAIHGYTGKAHVSVSKHGNWGLVKALGKEFGGKGITANLVSPGPIASVHQNSAMTRHIQDQQGRIPTGRLGTPGEVAAVVSMLASDKGAFVNGQILNVNGGTET